MKKTLLTLLLITVAFWFGVAAQTKIRLATQVIDTPAAGTVFAGPESGSPAVPTFRTLSSLNIASIPKANDRRWWIDIGTGGSTTLLGNTGTNTGTASNFGPSSTEGAGSQWLTSTTDGNVASRSGAVNEVSSRNLLFQTRIKLSSTATRRDWQGLTDQTAATMGASDNPAGNYAAFLYSSAIDGNWHCVSKDNTTQETNPSGVAASSSSYVEFQIVENIGTSYDFYIDGSKVCTNSTHIPTSNTPMRYVGSVTCVSCNPTAQNFRRGWAYGEENY